MQLEHGAEIGHEFDPAGKPVVEAADSVERQALGDTVEVGWPRDAGLVFAGQTNAGATEERT